MLPVYTIAFFSGLAVMAIELSASRLIAPYFGTSLFVWTNVIAVILAALSLGYFLGGRISERSPNFRTLLGIILAAGLMLAVVPFIVGPVASVVALDSWVFTRASFVIVAGSFLLSVLLFFLPIMLLGMVSPYLVKIVSLRRKDMGNVAGRIFAIGTVGSIIGTFLPALVFIPLVGTKFTILIFASALIIMGFFALPSKRFFILLPLIGIPFGTLSSSFKMMPGGIAEAESAYQYIQVVEGTNGARYLIYNEGGGIQSVYHPDTVWHGGEYWDYAALLPALADGKQVLVIGLAGGTIARGMHTLFGDRPNFHIDGVEIDQKVTELAATYFNLDIPTLSVVHADGRAALAFGDDVYDVLFVDAYTNQLYIPFHLATKEFFALAREHLAYGGVIAINVNAPREDSELLLAITNTMAAVFPNVYRFHVEDSWNYLLLAADRPIDVERLRALETDIPEVIEFREALADGLETISHNPAVQVLTDDHAPLEHMTDAMIWRYARERLRQ